MSRNSEGTSENASELIELARKKFGKLHKAEEKLFRCFADGKPADYSVEREEDNNPAKSDKWGRSRLLDADRITWMCTDPQASAMVTHKGILVKGARIDGELDLSDAKIPFPLWFEKNAFPGGINLQHAEIRNLNLVGTHSGPIYCDGLKVEGSVFLRDVFMAEGEFHLVRATIGGDLDFSGGKLIQNRSIVLDAYSANIKGSIYLRDGFKSEGEVNLASATIGGDLDCCNGCFINSGAMAFNASGANIKGGVFLRDGFKSEGEVNLVSAMIGGVLDCGGGYFINIGGRALNARWSTIEGSVFLSYGFKAVGEVNLVGAKIYQFFVWIDVSSPESVTLDLRSAKIGILWDDKDSWPEEGNLFLHGLVYNEIYEEAPRDADSRIEWVRRQPDFRPQPYEQLAGVLGKSGQDKDARKILIAKDKEKAGLKTLTWWEKCWYRGLWPMIGYGYQPLNALRGGLVFVVLGWILFGTGYWGRLITPHSEYAYVEISVKTDDGEIKRKELSDVYPKFNFLVYSFDTFVPLIDLHQSKYWLPNANRVHKIKGLVIHTGGLLRFYLWFHIFMGYLLSTLLVVGLRGLMQKKAVSGL